MRVVVLCLLLLLFQNCFCKNILFVSDMPSPSHKIWNFALAEGLTRREYNVTMLSPDFMKHLGKNISNYHPIYFEGHLNDELGGSFDPNDLGHSKLADIFVFLDYVLEACQHTLHSKGLQTLLDYPENFKFELIIFDTTASGCLLPLIRKFKNPPAVAVTAFLLPYYISAQFGNALYPSYVPSYLVQYTQEMDFFQRLDQYVWMNIDYFLREWYMKPNIISAMQQKFGHDGVNYVELENRLSLLLCNLEPSFHTPQPVIPNIIPVGGLHIKPGKSLPTDLEEIVAKSKEGIVLFSMGTNIRSDKLGSERIRALLKAFSQIKQTVLWKFESDLVEYDVPKNVIIRKWLPQNDILAHPKTKLFISHAGGLSTLETAFHAVPLLGIPIFADQHQNNALMEWRGIAKQLSFATLNEKDILSGLRELLENTKYLNRAKEISRIMRDQPQTPLERALFWLEYTIRHNGTQFLDTRARSLPLFISTSSDIVLFLFVVISLAIFIILKSVIFIKNIISKMLNVKLKKQ